MAENRTESGLEVLRGRLEALKASIHKQLRAYPTPITGCDEQFNHLLEQRDRVFRELGRLDGFTSDGATPGGYAAEVERIIRDSGLSIAS